MSKLTVESVDDAGRPMLAVSQTDGSWGALLCLDRRPSADQALLAPVRVCMGDSAAVRDLSRIAEAARQTKNLGDKLRSIDRLGVTNTCFADRFVAARVFLFGDAGRGDEEGWRFGREAVRLLATEAGARVIAQVDYDQRRMHPQLGGALDSIDFMTKHDPSAAATVVAFETVLDRLGLYDGVAWGVKGGGDLGGRIIVRAAASAREVFVAERVPERMALVARIPKVTPVAAEALPDANCQAVVFAADAGSLTAEVAARLATNSAVRAVGGPEAALDRDAEALRILADAGKWFIPSVLCGSLGLIANLEESLGLLIDCDALATRLRVSVEAMADEAVATGTPFHDVCAAVLRGRAAVR